MNNPNLWNQLLVWPITNILIFFYKIFEWLHIPGPLGWAVIALTLFIRLILTPLMHTQMKSAKKMSSLKPHLDALAAKHKGDKTALQQAQLALYKEHGVKPAAGCLPLLVQMPVLIALYSVFNVVLNDPNTGKVVGEINKILYVPALKLSQLDLTFLGTNLGIKPSDWQKFGWWLLAIPLITGLLQWWQTKLMMPASKLNTTNTANATNQLQKKDAKEEKKVVKQEPDFAADMQKQMAIISPIMFGWFAFQFPLGLALYWNVFGLFGIMHQIRVNKS
jgi:YidC/Oxa1 family membrane protein insertase